MYKQPGGDILENKMRYTYTYILIYTPGCNVSRHTQLHSTMRLRSLPDDKTKMKIVSDWQMGVMWRFRAHAVRCLGAHRNFPRRRPPSAFAAHIMLSGRRKTVAPHIDRPLQRFRVHTVVHTSINAALATNDAHLTCRNITFIHFQLRF